METIAYTIGSTTTEVSFTALGIGASPRLTFGTHGASKFTLPLPGIPPEAAQAIPFEAPCKVYTGRTGSGASWTGGSILFQGRRTDNSGHVSGNSASSELIIEDAWYDLRFLTLQATWQVISGGTIASPTYGTATWPDCVLFQATPGLAYSPIPIDGHITTGQAIVEILNYAITYGGVNLQVGVIDPNLYVPYYPVRSMRCADAIKIALRVHPDCTCEIDYTTTPPTFNIRQRSNLTALTLPYDGQSVSGGVTQTHLTSQVKPRPDLIPTRVGIYLKETSTVDGQTVISIGSDIYPAVSTGLRSFDVSLDMSGPKSGLVTGQITAYAFEPGNLAFWTTNVPTLNSATHPEVDPSSLALINSSVNDGSLQCITVLDSTGTPIDLTTYLNLVGNQGTIHPWMNLLSIEAFVTGYVTYQQRKNIGTAASPVWINIGQPNSHPHTVKIKLTNAPAGTTQYQLSTLLGAGEVYPEWYVVLPSLAPVPAGTSGATLMTLAHYVYLSLETLQYQFSHTILQAPAAGSLLPAPPKPGKHALNVTGGATAWETMQAMVQEVTIDFINSPITGITSAKTTVSCGPVEHLEPGQLVQLFNLFCNRDLSKINPNERDSGLPNGGLNAAMPSDTAKENTTPAVPDAGQTMFSAADSISTSNLNGIQHDPANGQINVLTYHSGSGTPVGSGLLAPCYFGSGAPSSTTLPANVNFRLNWRYVDTSGNAEYYCVTAGNNSTSIWTQLSGGVGGSGGAVWI